MIGLKRGTVKLTAHYKEWANLFKYERKSLKKLLGSNIKIEHIGSTAIPGVLAKPIIDIAVGYTNEEQKESTFSKLRSNGYEDRGEKGRNGRRFFAKGPDHNRTYYLHVTQIGSNCWNEQILFRDFLKQNKNAREAYNELKIKLADEFADNREQYTERKSEFIQDIINRAS